MLQKIFEFFQSGAFTRALAYQHTVKEAHRQYLLRNVLGFARAMERQTKKGVVIGIHGDSGKEVLARIPLQDLFAHHLIQGRSGSGKSRYAESLLPQLLRSFPEVGVVLIDGKGELFARARLMIAALLYPLKTKEREGFLDRVVIIDPFHPSVIPSLNFCVPLPGYPAELLAEDILGGLRRLFVEEGITARMEVVLRNVLTALIEAGRDGQPLSLLEARNLLTDEAFRERVLLQVRNEETKIYFAQDFTHESRGTIEAVKSRLSYLLLAPQVRYCLGAGDGVQFREVLEQGKVVLINLGKTLLATDKTREVIGTLVLSSFLRAVFSRLMNHGPYVLTFMDEFQNFVLPEVFEKLYTEARAYRCFVTAICQQLTAQIPSRALRDIIVTNSRYLSLFASSEEDARLLGRIMFRPTGSLPKRGQVFSQPKEQRFYTEAEELELFIRRVPSLKPRRCYFWDKESPFGAQLLQTQTVPEPHAYAGIREGEFTCFCEELEPLWKRMGTKKEEAKTVIEQRHQAWGIGQGQTQAPAVAPARNRRAVLQKLEAHLGKDTDEDE